MILKFINLKQLNLEQIQLKTKSANTFTIVLRKKTMLPDSKCLGEMLFQNFFGEQKL